MACRIEHRGTRIDDVADLAAEPTTVVPDSIDPDDPFAFGPTASPATVNLRHPGRSGRAPDFRRTER